MVDQVEEIAQRGGRIFLPRPDQDPVLSTIDADDVQAGRCAGNQPEIRGADRRQIDDDHVRVQSTQVTFCHKFLDAQHFQPGTRNEAGLEARQHQGIAEDHNPYPFIWHGLRIAKGDVRHHVGCGKKTTVPRVGDCRF